MYDYCVCGLIIASEIDLPGLISTRLGEKSPDVTIRRAQVPQELDDPVATGPNWRFSGTQLLLRIPGVVRFLVTEGKAIVFEAEGNTPAAEIASFLVGSAFAVLLHQRRQIVIRASAVCVGGKAVLFCGPSGTGKSTIAAALGRRGYPLLNDDLCTIDLDPMGTPFVLGDHHRLTLWGDTIQHLDLTDHKGPALRSILEKFYVEPHGVCLEPRQLGAVYTLRETRPPFCDGIERPNAIDTTLLIHQSAYHPRMVAAMQQQSRYFLSAAKIAGAAGVFYLTRPRDFACTATVIGWLEEHWRMIGLLGTSS